MKNKNIKQNIIKKMSYNEIQHEKIINNKSDTIEYTIETNFFYNNNEILNNLDNNDILNKIKIKYPDICQTNKDIIIKKTIIQILDDENFIKKILEYYDISIFDFFKILYRQYNSIFNTAFINKLKNYLKSKNI